MNQKFEIKTDCRAHKTNSIGEPQCEALTEMMCTYKDCPFYKTEEQYQEQQRQIMMNRSKV